MTGTVEPEPPEPLPLPPVPPFAAARRRALRDRADSGDRPVRGFAVRQRDRDGRAPSRLALLARFERDGDDEPRRGRLQNRDRARAARLARRAGGAGRARAARRAGGGGRARALRRAAFGVRAPASRARSRVTSACRRRAGLRAFARCSGGAGVRPTGRPGRSRRPGASWPSWSSSRTRARPRRSGSLAPVLDGLPVPDPPPSPPSVASTPETSCAPGRNTTRPSASVPVPVSPERELQGLYARRCGGLPFVVDAIASGSKPSATRLRFSSSTSGPAPVPGPSAR